jgi:dTDP-4-amino-4,6-dideoxygalactose transaminase
MSQILAIHGGPPVRTAPFPSWPVFDQREEEALLRALRSGKWGRLDGAEVERFERRFAEYHQAKHGIAVVNGTVALRVVLMAAGLETGDEVIVPPYTFLATATAVVEANGTPVFADIELSTLNIDPRSIETALSPRTRAIIPVHLAGLPVDMDAIKTIAERHGLTVIEDAAHAHGAQYKGRRVGAIGDLGTFSFQSTKNLTCGEGGIILTNNDQLAERCRSIHNCGRIPGGAWYEHHLISGNYRLGEFQGAVLNSQFDRFDAQARTRAENGNYLAERLKQIPGVFPQASGRDCTRHGYHLFVFRIDPSVLGVSRDVFIEALSAEGIPACAGYMLPLYRQPLFQNRAFGPFTGYRHAQPDIDYRQTQCPNCETICGAQGGWLEQSLLLGSRQDMDDIVDAFEKVQEHCHELAAARVE